MKKTLTIFALLISAFATGQNLVPDGSFEQDTACPNTSPVSNNLYWISPTAASPDYFDTCASTFVNDVPNNFVGGQPAFGGAYVGMITYAVADYKEYVQVRLTDSLIAGTSYCVSYYVSLAGKSAYATAGPQLYFSDSAISSTGQVYFPYVPQIQNLTIITDTTNWIMISGTYIANGGEKYITIGNFYSDVNTPYVFITFGPLFAYFYVDNVSVVNCDSSSGIDEHLFSKTISLFPNPARQKATLYFANSSKDNFTLTIYDSQGQLVQTITNVTSDKVEIERQNLNNGLYFYRLQSDKNVANGKFIFD